MVGVSESRGEHCLQTQRGRSNLLCYAGFLNILSFVRRSLRKLLLGLARCSRSGWGSARRRPDPAPHDLPRFAPQIGQATFRITCWSVTIPTYILPTSDTVPF
jgi:hypothetical protein